MFPTTLNLSSSKIDIKYGVFKTPWKYTGTQMKKTSPLEGNVETFYTAYVK